MEKEFSSAKSSIGSLSVEAKVTARKLIAVCISVLLLFQIALMGFQAFGAQAAYGATLPSGLVYKYAYGVRSDGVSCFRNNGYDGVIVNSSGKVVFKEVYKDKTETYTDGEGKKQSHTYKEPVLTASSSFIHADYYNGNLMICKRVYDPHEETYSYTGYDGKTHTGTYQTDYRYLYGLLNPQTGKYVLQLKSTYEEVISYCKKRGWKTDDTSYQSAASKWKLPNGTVVQLKYDDKSKGYKYVKSNGSAATVAGYQLGNTSAFINDNRSMDSETSALFRKGVAGGNLYYVHNNKGKVGAINDKGKVLIPFEYDAYADANAGSSYILLKKGGSWKYFDLNTIGKSSTAQKAGWQKSSKGWWYRYSNGSYAKGLKKIGNATYYFDKNGWMKTGWQKISGSWYYFASSGAMAKGWTKTGGKWYYMNSAGKMLTGWQKLGGKKYYFTSSGAMKTGWLKSGSDWYYLNGSGAMVTNKWVGNYWLLSNGKMAKSKWVNNGKYYVGSNGVWVPGKKK